MELEAGEDLQKPRAGEGAEVHPRQELAAAAELMRLVVQEAGEEVLLAHHHLVQVEAAVEPQGQNDLAGVEVGVLRERLSQVEAAEM